jgi:hypothetical protein
MVLLALRPNYDSVSFLHDRERRGSEIFFFEGFVGAIYFSVNVYRDLIFRAVRYVDRPEVDIDHQFCASRDIETFVSVLFGQRERGEHTGQ